MGCITECMQRMMYCFTVFVIIQLSGLMGYDHIVWATDLSELAQAPSVRRPTSPSPPISPGVSRNTIPVVPESLRGLVANGPSLDILIGEWLNREYYDRLIATRSPKAAIEGVSWCYMTITRDAGAGVYTWLQVINFHEGLSLRLTGLAATEDEDTYRPVFVDSSENRTTSDNRFIIQQPFPPDEIEWRFNLSYEPGNIAAAFVRIPDGIDRFVTSTVIAGRYVDEEGESYTFTENGVAVWPDTTFTFKMQIDTMFSECDAIMTDGTYELRTSGTAHYSYGFFWDGDRLLLYNTFYDDDEVILRRDKEPFAVLTPVTD